MLTASVIKMKGPMNSGEMLIYKIKNMALISHNYAIKYLTSFSRIHFILFHVIKLCPLKQQVEFNSVRSLLSKLSGTEELYAVFKK